MIRHYISRRCSGKTTKIKDLIKTVIADKIIVIGHNYMALDSSYKTNGRIRTHKEKLGSNIEYHTIRTFINKYGDGVIIRGIVEIFIDEMYHCVETSNIEDVIRLHTMIKGFDKSRFNITMFSTPNKSFKIIDFINFDKGIVDKKTTQIKHLFIGTDYVIEKENYYDTIQNQINNIEYKFVTP